MKFGYPFAALSTFAATIAACPAQAEPVAEQSVPAFVRKIGDAVSRRPVGPDDVQADKLLAFRLEKGELVITAMVAVPPNDPTRPSFEADSLGIIRTRPTNRAEGSQPDKVDLAFAKASAIPVYIVGEWSKPPVIWEIAPDGDDMLWRTIDYAGLTGPWQQLILP